MKCLASISNHMILTPSLASNLTLSLKWNLYGMQTQIRQRYHNVRFHVLAVQHRLSHNTTFVALPAISPWGSKH